MILHVQCTTLSVVIQIYKLNGAIKSELCLHFLDPFAYHV